MPRAFQSLLALALLGLVTACGELAQQLSAEEFAVASLVKVPGQENPATHESVPGVVTFQLFFGTIDKTKIAVGLDGKRTASAGAFRGAPGATVTLLFNDPARGETSINVSDVGGGNYLIDSQTANLLTYSETDYVAQIAYGGLTYRLQVKAPAAGEIKEFAAQTDRIVHDHPAGTDFGITRLKAAGAQNPIAFVNLSGLSGNARADAWNNVPKDAFGFLQLALADDAWRADTFKIPGAQLQPGNAYLVTMTSLERGDVEPGSPALFLGSTFLAGVATGGGVLVK